MKTPARSQVLIDEGLIDNVLRKLKSGKQADVFVVRCGDEARTDKVYSAATHPPHVTMSIKSVGGVWPGRRTLPHAG
jgi:hypothetical protein